MESSPNARATPTTDGVAMGRDQWGSWVDALRRYQLDGLMGWFLDAGRPLAFLSAQLMYIASPFVGTGIEKLGRMLESDEESQAFARLLSSPKDLDAKPGGGGSR